MTFPLACADYAFPLLSHKHSLDLIEMLGFDGYKVDNQPEAFLPRNFFQSDNGGL